jgi:hypothetical protein
MNNILDVTCDKFIFEEHYIHLRISDIVNMPIGTSIELLCFDSSSYTNMTSLDSNVLYPIEDLLELVTTIQFTKTGNGIIGLINNVDNESVVFEFDIEYQPNTWYPLTNNSLPFKDEDNIVDFGNLAGMSYLAFSANTRIGWRGPVVIKSTLLSYYQGFFYDNK